MSSNITSVMDLNKGYRVDIKHCWVDGTPTKVYFIENMPFTFETLNRAQKEDQWILYECLPLSAKVATRPPCSGQFLGGSAIIWTMSTVLVSMTMFPSAICWNRWHYKISNALKCVGARQASEARDLRRLRRIIGLPYSFLAIGHYRYFG